MSLLYVEMSRIIDAPAEDIYAVIADYKVGHPAILPKPFFTGVEILTGGNGAGTIVYVFMKIMGVKQVFKMEVTEPHPGKILVETDKVAGVETTFTIEPGEVLNTSKVTISTYSRLNKGIRGLIEKYVNPAILRRIYKKELLLLEQYVLQQMQTS